MGKAAERLTDAFVRRLSAGDRPQVLYWDTEIGGFAVRVTHAGCKAFVLDYRIGGRQRRITLGNYPDWSVQAAREAAKNLKREVDVGRDPMGERHAERAAPTIAELWEIYSREYLPRKAQRSQLDERLMWERLILPRLGKEKVAAVTHEQVEALHNSITVERGTPVRANRTIEVLRKALNWAIRRKWRTDNPASGVHRNPEEKRQRYLTPEELNRLCGALDRHRERSSAAALKFLILTGARMGEALNATWDQFDLGAGIWIKPSAHTKQRREHRVPLSQAAMTLLQELRASSTGRYVFPGKSPDKQLTDVKRTWRAVCEAARLRNTRIHDLRHSFASLLVSEGASLPVIGQLLGHTQVSTTARYSHLYDDVLRSAAEKVGSAIHQR
jgi:integrase